MAIPFFNSFLVSPGFRPRPSLSALERVGSGDLTEGVAGVSAPAFVERRKLLCLASDGTLTVSPGFRPRPSLSDHVQLAGQSPLRRVAGVSAPAFVERTWVRLDAVGFLWKCRRGFGPGLR